MNVSFLVRLFTSARSRISDPLVMLVFAQSAYIAWGIPHGFALRWIDVGFAIIVATLTELIIARTRGKALFFPWSAIAAALGIGIFFRASFIIYFGLAAFLAIASKHLIRPSGNHIFNPSNFGIVALVFLFPSATTIEFTQWGGDLSMYAAVAAISFYIAFRARVLLITGVFLSSYLLGYLLIGPYYFTLIKAHFYGVLSPSIILFASFMITDPRTAPRGFYEQIMHGLSAAFMYFFLEIVGIRYALFLASFLIAAANFLSGYASNAYFSEVPFLHRKNSFTFLACSALFLIVTLRLIAIGNAAFAPWNISPSYVLRGIENAQMLRCSGDPIFKAHTAFGSDRDTYGVAWGDFDDDGYDDVFVSNLSGAHSSLYKNNGDGTFTDVTASAGLPAFYSSSAYFVDYDNNGTLDLFVLDPSEERLILDEAQVAYRSIHPVRLLKNTGGRFKDVTAAAGLGDIMLRAGIHVSASFADYDKDGDLDFVLSSGDTYLRIRPIDVALIKSLLDPFYNQQTEVICDKGEYEFIDGTNYFDDDQKKTAHQLVNDGACLVVGRSIDLSKRNYTLGELPALNDAVHVAFQFSGSQHIFENRSGIFIEHPAFSKTVQDELSGSRYLHYRQNDRSADSSGGYFGPVSFDYDGDGLTDIFIPVHRGASLMLKNRGDLNFSIETATSGLAYQASNMGVAVSDYDHDGVLDFAVTNILDDYLFFGQKNGVFRKSKATLSLGFGWGIVPIDYDLDGSDDIFIANGDTENSLSLIVSGLNRPLLRSNNLYRNDGAGDFSDVTSVDMCPDGQSGKALAVSDYDNNGTPDVLAGNRLLPAPFHQNNVLYTNTRTGNYLKIKLAGTIDNSRGIGSEITVVSGDLVQKKIVLAGSSFYSQDSSRIIFGFGSNDSPVDISVKWPSGKITERRGVPINREITIEQ